MLTPSYLQFSSVPPPIAEASELERALLAVVPVSPRLDASGKEIAGRYVPMSAIAFQERHDGTLEEMLRRQLAATNGIPKGVRGSTHRILTDG